jgi:hypothetical protein
MTWRFPAAALLGAIGLAACGAGDASREPGETGGPVIVTFEVVDERFTALLTDPVDVAVARRLLAGEDAPGIPNGKVLRETGVNTGYSWSMDPNDIEFADVTVEVCDGLPSEVEADAISGDRYCPSSAIVVAIDPVP